MSEQIGQWVLMTPRQIVEKRSIDQVHLRAVDEDR